MFVAILPCLRHRRADALRRGIGRQVGNASQIRRARLLEGHR